MGEFCGKIEKKKKKKKKPEGYVWIPYMLVEVESHKSGEHVVEFVVICREEEREREEEEEEMVKE